MCHMQCGHVTWLWHDYTCQNFNSTSFFFLYPWAGDQLATFGSVVECHCSVKHSTPGLTILPKLKYEHIHLTSYRKMRVDLAAQVWFIGSYMYYVRYNKITQCMHIHVYHRCWVSLLHMLSPRRRSWNRTFCQKFWQSFDCMNVQSLNEA